MRKILLSLFTLGMFTFSMSAYTNDYGIPDDIQQGNILHCFNWPIKTVTENLKDIAEAGYGSVQLSPLQRSDVASNWHWYDLYCPYDIALCESSALGTRQDLKTLCTEAEKYGIKVIVDVVANHINWTESPQIYYNKAWWSVGDRTRSGRSQPGDINYSNRQQITQHRMGDYFEVNSENQDVINRTVDYIKDLASCGVKGIRWDAAKHIALPSESQGGQFWAKVTSCVPGMYHYGEILDEPVQGNGSLIKEYVKYMSVTDNRYSNQAARNNGGIPTGANGDWVSKQGVPANKIVYWGESHDTYSNDEWSQNVDQSVIDRAYAAYACRKGSTALYLARPNVKGFGNIPIQKGTDDYKKNKGVKEVNKFRNLMEDRADFFTNVGNACSITRKDGGAVIVMKGSGQVNIANGGGYCPPGTYKDRVSENTFTVTSTTISGNVGNTGIAVIYSDDFDVKKPAVTLNPGTQSFKTETLSITASLNEAATSGWYKIGTGSQVNLSSGSSKTITIGEDMKYGDKLTINWSATGADGTFTGSETYTKVDPNAGITIYVQASTAPYLYAWIPGTNTVLNGAWPGTIMSSTKQINGTSYYYQKFTDQEVINIIFNNNKGGDDNQTKNIEGITSDSYFTYNGTNGYTVLTDIGGGNSDDNNQGGNADIPSGNMFVIGQVNGADWNFNNYVAMEAVPGHFVAKNISLGISNEPEAYFSFAGGNGNWSSWDSLNADPRYTPGAKSDDNDTSKDIAVSVGNSYQMVMTKDNGRLGAWHIETGTYDLVIDPDTNTLTVYSAGGSPDFSDNGGDDGDDEEDNGDNDEIGEGNIRVHFDNTDPNFEEVWAYCYIPATTRTAVEEPLGEWPGTKLTGDKDNLYSVVIPAGSVIIFNNNNKIQTTDIQAEANHIYSIDLKENPSTDGNENSIYGAKDKGEKSASVENLIDHKDSSVTLSVLPGAIILNGLNGEFIQVAGLDGKLYYRRNASESLYLTLERGIYVVSINGKALKVIVK